MTFTLQTKLSNLNVAKLIQIFVAVCLVFTTNAYAALTINISESGGNVTVDATGSFKIPPVGSTSNSTFVTGMNPNRAGGVSNITFVNGNSFYQSSLAPTCTSDGRANTTFGPTLSATQLTPTNVSGNFPFYLTAASGGVLWVSTTASVGTVQTGISNSATYAGDFATLGITAGVKITCTYGGRSADETIYISTGQARPVVSNVSQTVAFNSIANNVILNSTGPADSVDVSTQALHGTATASGKTITYTPTTGYSGSDTFQYTATNSLGTSLTAATVTITVNAASSVATLSGMIFSSGALSPAFVPGTTTYTQSVANTATSLTVTPTVTLNSNATVKVNGTTVTSGSASGSIALNVGANTISTVVTAQNGTTTNTYTTTVTRAAAAPTVTAINPTSGTTAGGTSVTITGTNFTGATGVTIGGTAATGVTVTSDTSITATTPTGAAGTASVVVTTPAGSNAANTLYTYVAAPTITSLATTSGTTAGGTSVVITGTNFTSATAVTFGGTAASSYTVNSATQITATTPAHAAGVTDVVVTTTGGAATSTGAYTYIAPVFPAITSVNPALGPVAGGTSVTITGTGFTGATAVTFGGTAATSYTVNSATQITATTPAHAAGAVSLLITTANGTNTANTLFTYASSTATLSAMSISSGTLSPTFASGTGTYTASVPNATASITVTPTVTQANATITVNGTAVTSGSASSAISLSVGSNIVTTVVTAQDGTTTQTYTTTVTRAALLAQAAFTVSASPTTLNATTTTSTLSTSGGSGTGAVTYAMTSGTCTLSGTTVTAGSASETCTVTATKASDGTYAAATATVSITVAKRATIAAAAADSSVTTLHAAQVMQAQKFAVTQVQNVTAHLDSLRHNFTLQPSNLGIGLNIPSFSGPMSQVFYKIKDELTYQAPAKQVSQRSNLSSPASSYSSTPFLKTASVDEGAPKPFNDYLNDPSKDKQDNQQEQSQPDEAPQGYYKRESLTYSFWSAGTIDVGTFMTGQKDALNKLRASGLTFGLDYKLDDAAIVGGAIGVGKGWINDNSSSSNIQSNQLTFTGYGMVALDGTWIVDGLAGYGRMDISGIRTTSDGSAVLGMSRRGDTFFSSISVSKLYWIGGLKISPFIREDWIKINLGSYSETGAADYALGYDGTNIINTKSSAGLFIVHDEYLERGKLTTSAKFAMNVAKTGDIQQNIYYVDTGSSGGTATLSQLSTNQVSQSVTLGMLYTQKSGDSFDIGFTQAVGANQYKQSSYRFTLRFAM